MNGGRKCKEGVCVCERERLPSLKGKPFLDSDGLTDHVYLYENGTGKTWNKTCGCFTGMKVRKIPVTLYTSSKINSVNRFEVCVKNRDS